MTGRQQDPFKVDIITIFPGMLDGFLKQSMLKLAVERGAAAINTINLRDFTRDKHQTTDDRPYGGGPGMVMKPEPLFEAVESVKGDDSRVILLSPQGQPFDQAVARRLSKETHLVFVCGHYEGVDERVREHLVDEEISIGDYVLTNGVLPAAVVVDSVVRLLPGVLGGGDEASVDESFTENLLEHPQYTRPAEFKGWTVPEILTSGNHEAIAQWRQEQREKRTSEKRPDLLNRGDQQS